jgi:hypothetical protein
MKALHATVSPSHAPPLTPLCVRHSEGVSQHECLETVRDGETVAYADASIEVHDVSIPGPFSMRSAHVAIRGVAIDSRPRHGAAITPRWAYTQTPPAVNQ